MITHKQRSLADIFTDCQNKFDHDKYPCLELLENTINLDEIVPVSFISHFHAATGKASALSNAQGSVIKSKGLDQS